MCIEKKNNPDLIWDEGPDEGHEDLQKPYI